MERVLGDKKAIALLLLPALLIYTLVMLVPVIISMQYTFYSGNAVRGFEYVGFDNFTRLVQDPAIREALWFTVKYAVIVTLAQVALGYGYALLYQFSVRRGSSVIRTLLFFPVVLPTVAVALLFQQLFQVAPQPGLVNSLLNTVGIDSIDWFGNGTTAFLIIVIMDLWRSAGFYAVLLYTGLLDIPEDVIESAKMEGASTLHLIRHIIVPLSLPVLLSSLIFSINGTIKVFDSIVALTNGGPGDDTTPLTVLMFRTSFNFGQYGYGATIALLLTAMSLLFTVAIFRSARRDNTKV
jgi:raffinose/stachyose/melibiose transport system permease protein